MVDKKRIKELIEWYDKNYKDVDPWVEEAFWNPLVNALGDDEDEVIEYLSNASPHTRSHMSSVVEEIHEKFKSPAMSELLQDIYDEETRRCAKINAKNRSSTANQAMKTL